MGRPHVHGDYGKGLYDNMLYKYRGKVPVVPLQMVDNIISAVKCGKVMKLSEKKNIFQETIKERRTRGNPIVSNMRALLRDIPLGSFRTQIGLVLQQTGFLKGVCV